MSVDNNVIFQDFNLTPRAKKAYSDAKQISEEFGHKTINNLHIMYGCLKNISKDLDDYLFDNGYVLSHEDVKDSFSFAVLNEKDKFYTNKKKFGFIFSFILFLPIIIRIIFRLSLYSIFYDKKKLGKYKFRLSGLYNSIIGNNSYLRLKDIKN